MNVRLENSNNKYVDYNLIIFTSSLIIYRDLINKFKYIVA